MSEDSRVATYEHIQQVQGYMARAIADLSGRSLVHDHSKLESPERDVFDECTSQLKGLTYGSDEYKAQLVAMKPALDHHYDSNSHHPEHYRWACSGCGRSFSSKQAPENEWENGESHRFCPSCCGNGSVIWECELIDKPSIGIRGMSLLDLVEMVCDWKAATLRHTDGDIRKSIEINQARFGYGDELKTILLNTLEAIGA